MKVKFELDKFFTIAYFVPLFGVLGIFLFWQYSTIKEFHKIELNNFLTQTNKIVNVLIEKEKSEIRDTILSNISHYNNDKNKDKLNIDNIDFIFSTKNNKVTDIDGYNLFVDVEKLANKLKEIKVLQNVVHVNVDDQTIFMIVHKEKIINESLGKVIGELWGATIINGNVSILKEFKKDTGVEDLVMLDLDDNIIVSTLEIDKTKSLLEQNRVDNIFVTLDEQLLISKKSLSSDEELQMVFMLDNKHYTSVVETFKYKAIFAVCILAILGVILYIIIKIKFINKLFELKYFIQSSLQNNEVSYTSSSIVELDTIASEFEHLFKRFRHYQDNLEETVKEKTSENLKQMEILQQQSKLAQMGEMIGAIAHQWRQPLNVISTGIQNLKYDYKDGNLNDEKFIENFITENKKTIKFMSKTIDDFRSFFRSDKDTIDFNIKETVQSVLDMQSSQLRAHHIDVNIKGEEIHYNGLQSEFQQVILNIINNAKDALIENDIKNPTINIAVVDHKIIIQDNAGGVPPEIVNRIFEPYFTTKEQGKGTGIGLYLSKMIIEDNMKSKLEVENIVDGAQFTIHLNKKLESNNLI